MSMFSDNPRDQEDWTIHVSENKKHDDSKRPLYGASSQQGQTSPSEKQKFSEEKKQEFQGEQTRDDRGCFAKCCSWIYRCLRGCVRLAGKRKGSTMTLTASMAVRLPHVRRNIINVIFVILCFSGWKRSSHPWLKSLRRLY